MERTNSTTNSTTNSDTPSIHITKYSNSNIKCNCSCEKCSCECHKTISNKSQNTETNPFTEESLKDWIGRMCR